MQSKWTCYLAFGLALLVTAGCDQAVQSGSSSSDKVTAGVSSTTRDDTPQSVWPYLERGGEGVVTSNVMLAQNLYVVFDGSGSMGDSGCSGQMSKLDAAKRALLEFTQSLPAGANLGLIAFDNHGVKERVALSPGNREAFNDSVLQLQAGGGTPLNTSIRKAYARLTEQARRQLGYGEYHLVVVTDGEASSGENPEQTVKRILRESPLVIHTIGFCIDKEHSLHQPGRTLYRTANDYESLRQGLQSVLAEAPQFDATEFR